MIYTNLEALVESEKWEELQQAYVNVDKNSLPETLLSSHLLQDKIEPKLWRIVTVWKSKEDMDAYRKSVEIPAWFLVFRAVGSEPTLTISTVLGSK